MQKVKRSFWAITVLAFVALSFAACGGQAGGPEGDPNETAATVNGKPIKMIDLERAMKGSGVDISKMSPLELANARLQVLSQLIDNEVMYQKAESAGTVPSDDEVTAELNKQKTQSGKSADQIQRDMDQAGTNEAAIRDQLKKALAIQKLTEKITGQIGVPTDSEIQAFYDGNRDAFVKKKGVKLAAIVIDPSNSGEGDTTVDEQSAVIRGNEIVKQLQAGGDFASIAREKSEDQSRFQGGDLGYISEEDLRQAFPANIAQVLMDPNTQVGKIIITPAQGKYFILKLQERSDKDEPVTLESPGVRQQVTDALIGARKQLLQASYQTIAMNEAKVDNLLAKKVVANPNELSGARPAGAANSTPAANTNAPSNTNAAPSAANTNANANAKPAANTAKPAANAAKPANTAVKK